MRKVFIGISECSSGVRVAETIYNDYGAVIVSENTILDTHLINKLKNLSIQRIKIFEETDNIIIANNSELFKSQYKDNVDVVKDMLHEISVGKSVNMDNVNNISDSIVFRINENRDIVGCINEIRNVDEYTYTHSVNVSLLCMMIGKWLKYDMNNIKLLVQAGLMHDIGKANIPAEILNKPGNLTTEEFEEIKKHPVYGYRIAEKIPGLCEGIKKGILMHHEREDGSGYPVGMKGSQIHEYAKIIAVADIYDAMTSNRSYKYKDSPFTVFELLENKVFGVMDVKVVNTFLRNIAAYYIGDFVRLSSGEIGEIVYVNPRHISQPVIRINGQYIDLTIETGLKIEELI